MADEPETGGSESGGNVFTRKIGPLPLWAWMGIGLAIALGYYFWQQNQASNSSSSTSSTPQTASTVNTPGGVDSSLVPQFINQTYTSVSPPASPSVSVPSTITVQNGGTQSTGGQITMPNVAGQSPTQAKATLSGAGIGSNVSVSGPSTAQASGTQVIEFQNPAAGTPVAPGTRITLGYSTVANGKSTSLVKGKPVTTAETATEKKQPPTSG